MLRIRGISWSNGGSLDIQIWINAPHNPNVLIRAINLYLEMPVVLWLHAAQFFFIEHLVPTQLFC
jgi:hypothetical protein